MEELPELVTTSAGDKISPAISYPGLNILANWSLQESRVLISTAYFWTFQAGKRIHKLHSIVD
jgi:hypothetical protein